MKANLNYYEEKDKSIIADLAKYGKQSGILSFLRLISFLGAVALFIGAYAAKIPALYFAGGAMLIVFIVLCIVHGGILDKVNYLNELSKVNASYIARIKGDFNELRNIAVRGLKRAEDIGLAKSRLYGKDFEVQDHDYCLDLDVFGKKSLFSLFNVSETSFGRRRFADSLLNPHVSEISVEELKSKQASVKELCDKPDILMDFAENGSKTKTVANVLGIIGCLIWISVPVAYVIVPDYAAATIPSCLIINLFIFMAGRLFNDSYLKACEGMPAQVKTILKLYKILENAGFEDEGLKSLIKGSDKTEGAYESLKKLNDVLKVAALRSQPLFALLLNLIAPLDYLISFMLGNWAVNHGKYLPSYIDGLSEVEALMCAAQTGLVLPVSTFPEFVESDNAVDNAFFEGSDLAHPLLAIDSVVRNSVKISNDIAIITGSNMSGKTTMIRTVGVCTILSLTGGLVPATSLKLGRMRVMSSMRIVDSIEENMSTFKAELIRISGIVNAAGEEKALLFLIDEIFRGTNSDDRTEGALTVLKKLSKPYICGLMTTHDYAMIDKTQTGFNNIRYYHFSESYTDTEIVFDYKLSSGISRQSNAKYLMKLVGID